MRKCKTTTKIKHVKQYFRMFKHFKSCLFEICFFSLSPANSLDPFLLKMRCIHSQWWLSGMLITQSENVVQTHLILLYFPSQIAMNNSDRENWQRINLDDALFETHLLRFYSSILLDRLLCMWKQEIWLSTSIYVEWANETC